MPTLTCVEHLVIPILVIQVAEYCAEHELKTDTHLAKPPSLAGKQRSTPQPALPQHLVGQAIAKYAKGIVADVRRPLLWWPCNNEPPTSHSAQGRMRSQNSQHPVWLVSRLRSCVCMGSVSVCDGTAGANLPNHRPNRSIGFLVL